VTEGWAFRTLGSRARPPVGWLERFRCGPRSCGDRARHARRASAGNRGAGLSSPWPGTAMEGSAGVASRHCFWACALAPSFTPTFSSSSSGRCAFCSQRTAAGPELSGRLQPRASGPRDDSLGRAAPPRRTRAPSHRALAGMQMDPSLYDVSVPSARRPAGVRRLARDRCARRARRHAACYRIRRDADPGGIDDSLTHTAASSTGSPPPRVALIIDDMVERLLLAHDLVRLEVRLHPVRYSRSGPSRARSPNWHTRFAETSCCTCHASRREHGRTTSPARCHRTPRTVLDEALAVMLDARPARGGRQQPHGSALTGTVTAPQWSWRR